MGSYQLLFDVTSVSFVRRPKAEELDLGSTPTQLLIDTRERCDETVHLTFLDLDIDSSHQEIVTLATFLDEQASTRGFNTPETSFYITSRCECDDVIEVSGTMGAPNAVVDALKELLKDAGPQPFEIDRDEDLLAMGEDDGTVATWKANRDSNSCYAELQVEFIEN